MLIQLVKFVLHCKDFNLEREWNLIAIYICCRLASFSWLGCMAACHACVRGLNWASSISSTRLAELNLFSMFVSINAIRPCSTLEITALPMFVCFKKKKKEKKGKINTALWFSRIQATTKSPGIADLDHLHPHSSTNAVRLHATIMFNSQLLLSAERISESLKKKGGKNNKHHRWPDLIRKWLILNEETELEVQALLPHPPIA